MDRVFAGSRGDSSKGDGSFGGYMTRHRNPQWINNKVQMNSHLMSGLKTLDK
jgi:hypothetical protein